MPAPLISTRTPHAGSDVDLGLGDLLLGFQPALPMRGVTSSGTHSITAASEFQPALPMRGVTLAS